MYCVLCEVRTESLYPYVMHISFNLQTVKCIYTPFQLRTIQ
jgi:hypothetical protein